MRFMIMMKGCQGELGAEPSPELIAAVGKATEEGFRNGSLLSVGGLLPTSKGARLSLSGGKVIVKDGPFSEAKEVIGGFAIIQANSKQEAIENARSFLQLHAYILGDSYETECEVRQMQDTPFSR